MIQERRGIESPRRSLGLVPRMKLCSDREHFARPCPSRRRIREGWATLHWAVRMLVVKGLDIAGKTDAGLAAPTGRGFVVRLLLGGRRCT